MKVGDKVKFKEMSGNHIPDFTTNKIPYDLIIHGSTILDRTYYDEHYAKIVYEGNNNIYVVRYKDRNGKFVQLGFNENLLELDTIKEWRGLIWLTQ